eukprot:CAMPEP_0184090936 /NCGR_PEP_ID=MMETSP0974-20121125/7481_1 /TAXON_ID=483370 /ORGANISM="non described non described, Strain CCMP2097" /LENGTH=63 /DNA_ID=CAMNT_0026393663 /DNA_START=25 /DNA_END=213 /DNA_ORIENTATION=-
MTRLPSGENTQLLMTRVCPSNVICSVHVSASQSRAIPSLLAVTTRSPFGEKAQDAPTRECPQN